MCAHRFDVELLSGGVVNPVRLFPDEVIAAFCATRSEAVLPITVPSSSCASSSSACAIRSRARVLGWPRLVASPGRHPVADLAGARGRGWTLMQPRKRASERATMANGNTRWSARSWSCVSIQDRACSRRKARESTPSSAGSPGLGKRASRRPIRECERPKQKSVVVELQQHLIHLAVGRPFRNGGTTWALILGARGR